mmetsp:Transcript_67822/g.136490  ORF Transcript_67822/g.136490 Transcript_67822/m.136490 type:complete len:134 (+) Transcript_67822:55-456(+)
MDLWAQNVKRGLEGQEGPVMVAQKKGLTSDKLCDTHKFQGLLSASQYKRRREDVLDEVALTDSDAMKEVLARDAAEKQKANEDREAREAEKSRRLATSQTDDLESTKSTKKTKKGRKKAAAASSGLSFDVDGE